jgi:hypothetical protein
MALRPLLFATCQATRPSAMAHVQPPFGTHAIVFPRFKCVRIRLYNMVSVPSFSAIERVIPYDVILATIALGRSEDRPIGVPQRCSTCLIPLFTFAVKLGASRCFGDSPGPSSDRPTGPNLGPRTRPVQDSDAISFWAAAACLAGPKHLMWPRLGLRLVGTDLPGGL